VTRTSRRVVGSAVLAGALVSALPALYARAEVVLAVSTYSYRDLFRVPGLDNVEDVARAVRASGASVIALASVNVEPAGPNTGPAAPPRPAAYPTPTVVLSPEQVAAVKAAVREQLRHWRLAAPDAYFERVRARFYADNVSIHAYAVEFEADFTDAEIDATFRHAKLLGATLVSSRLTLPMAARVAPFAAKHGLPVAVHTQQEGNASQYISTADLAQALSASPALMVTLDIGHATASNRDATAILRQHLARVALVNVQDRLRNGGRSEPIGEGDTPVAEVLSVLRAAPRAVPVAFEYSYSGLGASAEEVRSSLAALGRLAR
jgi:sugar phosphate isomerase/epimerase